MPSYPRGLETQASDFNPLVKSASFVRPANTTQYSVGDLVTGATPAPLIVQDATEYLGAHVRIERILLEKSGVSLTAASFNVHIYEAVPAIGANTDNAALVTTAAGYIGSVPVTMSRAHSDGAFGEGVLTQPMLAKLGDRHLAFFIEAAGAYTPVSGETFTLTVEGIQLG